MTTKGPWKQLNALMQSYDKRFKYVQRRLGTNIVETLLERVKSSAPAGPEYKIYTDSLEAVQLTGEKDVLAFAVVSKRMAVKVGDVLRSNESGRTVVYINPTESGMSSQAVQMLASVNPWPIDLVPSGIKRKDVTLVHRLVLEDEVKFVRDEVKAFIAQNKSALRGLGLKWGQVVSQTESMEGMETLPDYMALALRAEFGINAKSKPHWRPAIRWIVKSLRSMVEKDDKIREALRDPFFRDHTLEKSGLPPMQMRQFEKENRKFEGKVLGK